jgi:hypothetical protein
MSLKSKCQAFVNELGQYISKALIVDDTYANREYFRQYAAYRQYIPTNCERYHLVFLRTETSDTPTYLSNSEMIYIPTGPDLTATALTINFINKIT